MMEDIKAYIFDMGGIIVDSEGINIKTAKKSYQAFGIKLDQDDLQLIIGRHAKDYNTLLASKYKFDQDKIFDLQCQYYPKFYKETAIIQDTVDFILKLKQRHKTLALASSSYLSRIKKTLTKTKLNNTFSVIISFEDCSTRKPFPKVYLIAAKKLKLKPSQCLVFEDTQIGVEAAKSAGMKVVALPNKYTQTQDFSKADLVVDSINELNIE